MYEFSQWVFLFRMIVSDVHAQKHVSRGRRVPGFSGVTLVGGRREPRIVRKIDLVVR